MKARQKLVENLAPDDDEDLSLFMTPTHVTKYVDATKGLFHRRHRRGNTSPA